MRGRTWQDYLVAAGAALFTPSVVLIVVPNGIILRNLDEVSYPGGLVVEFLQASALFSLFCFPIFLAAQRSRLFAIPARLLVLLGISVFLWDVVGLLPAKWIDSSLKAASVEGAFFSVALLVLFRLKLENLFILLAVVSPVLLGSTLVEHYVNIRPVLEQNSKLHSALHVSHLVEQASVELSNAFAYDQATSFPDVEVTWGRPVKITTAPRRLDHAVKIPIAVESPIQGRAYIHVRARVSRGKVQFGVLSSDHRRWLEGTLIEARVAPEPGDYYIAVPASTSLGPLVVANSVSRDEVRSIVEIFDISLNLVAEPAFASCRASPISTSKLRLSDKSPTSNSMLHFATHLTALRVQISI